MFVIGTAGHVDHGKSTLVKALTGIDPDRLQEEKEREMTIDLGFAWLTLPSGREVSVVDVPGHERFINNMLAGVHGMDLAMLVVAADEGVMPQTREHLAILDLLGVRRGLVALTKRDRVDDDWLDLVRADVVELLKGTSLAGAPTVAISSTTGEGLDELKALLDRLLSESAPRRDVGRPRLPIDRSFVMPGFGTVVTGTLVDGSLTVGQEIELVPSGLRARVRGLQSHRKHRERAEPGQRTAVNLSGVEHGDVQRGAVLTTPGWLRPTEVFDARLRVTPWSPQSVKHNEVVTFHTGTAETQARIRLLDSKELKPGAQGWTQLHLHDPLPLVKGDAFVVRSAEWTLGGGTIADPSPARRRHFQAADLARLEASVSGSPRDAVLAALEGHGVMDAQAVAKASGLLEPQIREQLAVLASEIPPLVLSLSKDVFIATDGWEHLGKQATQAVGAFHTQFPLRRGLPKEDLRSRLGLAAPLFPAALARLVADATLVEDGPTVRLLAHQPHLNAEEQRLADAYVQALEAQPFSPPTDRHPEVEVLAFLAEQGRVVRLSQEVVFGAAAYQQATERVLARLREKGSITVAEVRDLLSTSRKYALAIMEHLDQQHVTRRHGDERVLVGK